LHHIRHSKPQFIAFKLAKLLAISQTPISYETHNILFLTIAVLICIIAAPTIEGKLLNAWEQIPDLNDHDVRPGNCEVGGGRACKASE
jgi:hypothetical protein